MKDQSHKRTKRRVVPWFNSNEWQMVYKLIYGSKSDINTQKQALRILKIWKARTPFLHSGVEGTLIILSAIHVDGNQDSYNIRLLQSTNIMRFLNICAAYDKKQGTFYQTAKKRKIPEWIISLRHEAAHSQNAPMPDILKNALEFGLDWLEKNYWLPVSLTIRDFIAKTDLFYQDYQELKNELEPLFTNYTYLTITKHPNWNYYKIGNIADEDLRNSLKNDLMELLVDKNIEDSTKITYILKYIWLRIEKQLQTNNTKRKSYILPELLIEGELFLGNMENYQPDCTITIPKSFLFLWEKLLTYMQDFDMLPALIEKLIEEVYNEHSTHKRRNVAARWLAELGKAYSKCVFAQNLYRHMSQSIIQSEMTAVEINNKLKLDCEKKKAHFSKVLTLNLLSDIPANVTDVESFKKLFLKPPNEFTNIFLPRFLDLCDSLKNNETKSKLMELNKIYTSSYLNGSSTNDIYTIKHVLENVPEGIVPMDISEKHLEEQHDSKNDCWKLITDVDFKDCPIGVLPWQKNLEYNHLLNAP